MQIHQLKRVHKNMKRITVARGGKRGKTSGRGGKGQSARAGNKRRPEWRDIIKRLPKLRGRGVNQNKPVSDALTVINLAELEGAFSANDTITPTILVEKGIVSTWSGNIPAVKILGEGDVTKAFKISGCTISKSAKEKIEKAGGTVTALASRVVTKQKGPSRESDKTVVVSVPKTEKKEVKAKAPKAAKSSASAKAPADQKKEAPEAKA
ncbi:MAG: 50S ribosomal protein L15 [bacterium]|nr:50S ribosomal protein L15 [bacterium]